MTETGQSPSITLEAGASLRQIAGVERRPDGTIVAVFVDGAAGRLTELSWMPGTALAVRWLTLAAPVIDWPGGASLAAGHVLLSDLEGPIQLLDRQSGAVEQPGTVRGELAVLTPDGRAVISATGHGLLRHSLGRIDEGPAHLHWTRPMQVMDLDSPHAMALLAGETADSFSVVVGCYGRLAIVNVSDWRTTPTAHQARLVETDKLPYDPIHIALPVALTNASGTRVFVTDQGRAGLMAIALMPGLVDKCPLAESDYGAVRAVLPRLDGRQCLVFTRDDRWHRWLPGAAVLHALPDLGGWPVLWEAGAVLVYERESGTVREVAV